MKTAKANQCVMGACWCKEKDQDNLIYHIATPPQQTFAPEEQNVPPTQGEDQEKKAVESVDKLVLETLTVIGTLVDK